MPKILEPYQQRVVAEKDELEKKLNALNLFRSTDQHATQVEPVEQLRLERQMHAMTEYLQVLKERVAAFGG